jgi:hypothetical protein
MEIQYDSLSPGLYSGAFYDSSPPEIFHLPIETKSVSILEIVVAYIDKKWCLLRHYRTTKRP